MDSINYCNELMARMEELFFHELSDCAGWKTEFIGGASKPKPMAAAAV